MGIINFQGKRDKEIYKQTSQILVSDYMTKKLITFNPSDSLAHVINLLIKNTVAFNKKLNLFSIKKSSRIIILKDFFVLFKLVLIYHRNSQCVYHTSFLYGHCG